MMHLSLCPFSAGMIRPAHLDVRHYYWCPRPQRYERAVEGYVNDLFGHLSISFRKKYRCQRPTTGRQIMAIPALQVSFDLKELNGDG